MYKKVFVTAHFEATSPGEQAFFRALLPNDAGETATNICFITELACLPHVGNVLGMIEADENLVYAGVVPTNYAVGQPPDISRVMYVRGVHHWTTRLLPSNHGLIDTYPMNTEYRTKAIRQLNIRSLREWGKYQIWNMFPDATFPAPQDKEQ